MSRLLSIAAFALLAGVAVAQSSGLPPLESFTLGNGLRVVLAEDSTASTVDVTVCYAAGADWERAGQAGISHLYQRMLYRGSRQSGPGVYLRQLASIGATFSSSINPDGAWVWQTFPPEALDLVLRLEADRMSGASIDPARLENEKRILKEDRQARFARGVPRGLQRLYGLLFPEHPYGRGSIGEGGDLARLTPRDVSTWGASRFAPNTATLVVVGRFEPEAVRTRIRRLFGPITGRGTVSTPHPPFRSPVQTTPASERGEGPFTALIAGWRGPSADDPDTPACELIARLLASHSQSRLASALMRDSSVVVSVQTNFDRRRDASVLWALVRVRPDADTQYVARTLIAEIERLATAPPSIDELERARRPLLLNEYLLWQTPRVRAEALAEAVVERGDPGAAQARLAALSAVVPADIQRAAQRFLAASPHATVWLPAETQGVGR